MKNSTHGLRFHDLRHHAITELAESQASDQTIMSIAGHVSREMLERYSHIRMDAKRKALDALSGGGLGGGYGTKSDTKPPAASMPNAQVEENIGGRDRDRTGDLLVANEEKNLIRRGAATTYAFLMAPKLGNLGNPERTMDKGRELKNEETREIRC